MEDDQRLLLEARLNADPLVNLPVATDYVEELSLPSVPEAKPARTGGRIKGKSKTATRL